MSLTNLALALTAREARFALPNLYNRTVGIGDVAARLAIFVLWLRDELGSKTSPQFVARLNIRNAYIHKAADPIRVGEDAKRYRRIIRGRTATDVEKLPRVCDLDIRGRKRTGFQTPILVAHPPAVSLLSGACPSSGICMDAANSRHWRGPNPLP
jgi:hypothetical protein